MPIYGRLQYPQIGDPFKDTFAMSIQKIIAENLTRLMAASDLNTDQKLSQKSKVGYGTIQRARKGDGNITVGNLEAIAKAFRCTPTDLITPESSPGSDPHTAADSASFSWAAGDSTIRKIVALLEETCDTGRGAVLAAAREAKREFPRAANKAASSP